MLLGFIGEKNSDMPIVGFHNPARSSGYALNLRGPFQINQNHGANINFSVSHTVFSYAVRNVIEDQAWTQMIAFCQGDAAPNERIRLYVDGLPTSLEPTNDLFTEGDIL
ncbi:hypothetical protein [Pajaroellobacter abortibovis]|uniref:Uncharacterized protein n=1 Tax=Pajaroellobacter abortibovis TaxID=1882918 RepID=A0A1L6MXC4_9BACT|nr:hypothetical protein [Pajaroellobacter abortibovis]APS00180.1 hypothetical protein BCY86_05415 [Pajaroellobacter abortibovis]